MLQADGKTGWRYAEFSIPTGTHTYKWIYQKDFMSEDGSDCVWIDDIIFPCSSFTDVNKMNDNNIIIYPNPTNVNHPISLGMIYDKVEVYNSIGVRIADYSNVDSIDGMEAAGIYIIRVVNDKDVKFSRIVVR